jgi:hypothetical protein
MSCLSCASGNQAEFGAEINLHFPGPKNIDRATVWAFPTVSVCLECGIARFALRDIELGLLRAA